MIDGKQVGEAVAVDGKAICSTTKPGNPLSALQILSAYVTSSGIILGQESIHEKTNEIPVFQEMLTYLKARPLQQTRCIVSGKPAAGSCSAREIFYLGSKKTSLRFFMRRACTS